MFERTRAILRGGTTLTYNSIERDGQTRLKEVTLTRL